MASELPSQRLSARLKSLRRAQHLSQEQLAERAGLHRNFVSLMERGLNQPTVDTLFRLANALGIPADELVRQISGAATGDTSSAGQGHPPA